MEVRVDLVAEARAVTAEIAATETMFRRSRLSVRRCSMRINRRTVETWAAPTLLHIRKNTSDGDVPCHQPTEPILISTAIRWGLHAR